MKLYKEILLNTDSYSNPFKLPDGLIKNIFQLISEYSTPIIILCAIGILVSFCSLFSNKYSFLDKSFGTSSYSIAWISVFTVLAAFCLSVSFEDLGFTIFKTIVPTTAGFTALALLAQNDQKNRRESYERHKEYVRDNISNRRDRYSEAIEKIADGGKVKTLAGLRQLNSLAIEWSEDKSISTFDKNNELNNIAIEISDVFRKDTRTKNPSPSLLAINALVTANKLRGYYSPTELDTVSRLVSRILWKIIDERLSSQENENEKISFLEKPASWIIPKEVASRFLINSIYIQIYNFDTDTYNFDFSGSKINTPIDFSGFQGVDFSSTEFHKNFTIKPILYHKHDSYMINNSFSRAKFKELVEFRLTKFLSISDLPLFNETEFNKSVKIIACVFINKIQYTLLVFQKTHFLASEKSVCINGSLFYPSVRFSDCTINNGLFNNNYFLSGLSFKDTSFKEIELHSTVVNGLSIEEIKDSGNSAKVPKIIIEDSLVRNFCTIKGNVESANIEVKKSHFKGQVKFGDSKMPHHYQHDINISGSLFKDLEIVSNTQVSLKDVSVNSLKISSSSKGIQEIALKNIHRETLFGNYRASEIIIDGSRGIRNLTLEDIKTKILRIKNIDIGLIKNLKLCNIECEELDIDYLNNQEIEEIKNRAKISCP
ncbi:hypothetical protein [Rothia sp. HMSC066G02]|jgi:hypothetical protein|uniref:hypothetical protein n=1 Tax=Rothia sp. HMSC066G02 TaxID=1739398 RepID=UPI00114D2763|nr:hypothetical protein [Rothia sp. HMSC066G02]